ncbi:MAG: class I SAM-dependent methyltransferase [Chloroflexia bacterium]|nr:class I SAM-dependent methyltransferase [Chloroflexia bacterium]
MFNGASTGYDVAGFKSRRLRLQRLESDGVGDIAGCSLLHLQYHLGLDTLSWPGLGAAATGVDFSPRAIALARPLDEELRLDTRVVCADIYDLTDALRQHYDIDFTTY